MTYYDRLPRERLERLATHFREQLRLVEGAISRQLPTGPTVWPEPVEGALVRDRKPPITVVDDVAIWPGGFTRQLTKEEKKVFAATGKWPEMARSG